MRVTVARWPFTPRVTMWSSAARTRMTTGWVRLSLSFTRICSDRMFPFFLHLFHSHVFQPPVYSIHRTFIPIFLSRSPLSLSIYFSLSIYLSLSLHSCAHFADYLQVDALAAVPESLFEAPSGMPCHANDQPFGPTHTSGPVGRGSELDFLLIKHSFHNLWSFFAIGLDQCRFYMSSSIDVTSISFHCIQIAILFMYSKFYLSFLHEFLDLSFRVSSLALSSRDSSTDSLAASHQAAPCSARTRVTICTCCFPQRRYSFAIRWVQSYRPQSLIRIIDHLR